MPGQFDKLMANDFSMEFKSIGIKIKMTFMLKIFEINKILKYFPEAIKSTMFSSLYFNFFIKIIIFNLFYQSIFNLNSVIFFLISLPDIIRQRQT